ncbi:MAG TPA: hypothetical protein VIK68_02395 [Sphingomicrobium sp.]
MEDERIGLIEQIERCRRLAKLLSDDQMRHALEDLAEDYESRLRLRGAEPFLLRRTH